MTSCFLLIVVIFFPIENLMHYHLISYLVTFFSSFFDLHNLLCFWYSFPFLNIKILVFTLKIGI